MTPIELNRKGFKALVDALGYANAIRFIRQLEPGSGDYTKERDYLLNSLTMDDIIADIKQRQNHV